MAVPYVGFPTVDPQGGIGGSGGPQGDALAFGAGKAATFEQAGRNLEQAGQDVSEIVLAKAQITNELMANDAQTDFMKKATALYGDYQMQRGKGAEAALPQFQASMEALRQQALSSMPNEAAKMMLERGTRYYSNHVLTEAQSHANTQFWAWHDASATDAAEEFANQAVLATDPGARQGFLDAGVNEIVKLGERHGLSPDEMQSDIRKYKGRVLSGIIEQQAMDGDAQGAAALLHDYRGQMDAASVLQVERKLQPLLENDTAETIVNSLLGQTPAPKSFGKDGFENNIGNLRYSKAPWDQKGAPHNGFETFATPEAGVRAAIMNLAGYGDVTLEQAIYKWAPPSENDTEAYVQRLSKATGIDRDAILPLHSVEKMALFMKEMTRIEKGKVDFPDEVFKRGAESAIKGAPLPSSGASPLDAPEGTPEQKARMAAAVATMGPEYTAAADTASHAEASDLPTRPLPDKGEVYKKVLGLGLAPNVEAKVLSHLNTAYTQDSIIYESARRQVVQDAANLTAQAEDGIPDIVLPEGKIRALFPPDEAQKLVDNFNISKTAGQFYAGMKWMAPEDLKAAYDQFTSQSDNYELRSKLAAKFQQLADRRQKILFGTPGTGEGADPAGYVQDNPLVKAARAAPGLDSGDSAAMQNYATTVLDVQAHIGVPRVNQHVLKADDAKALASSLQQPNADVSGTLASLKRSWGAYYPQVLADLQLLGKLPKGYAVAEAMADPQARTAAYDALRVPAEELQKSIPEDYRREIDKKIEDPSNQLTQLIKTLGAASGAGDTADAVKKTVQITAYRLWSLNGGNADAAAATAIASVSDQKYDFIDYGRARAPKGQGPAVAQAADIVLSRLAPADLALPLDPSSVEELRNDPEATKRLHELRLDEVKLGHWVTNERDNGLYRVDAYGNPVMVSSPRWRGASKRLEIFFDNLPEASAEFVHNQENVPGSMFAAPPYVPPSRQSIPTLIPNPTRRPTPP